MAFIKLPSLFEKRCEFGPFDDECFFGTNSNVMKIYICLRCVPKLVQKAIMLKIFINYEKITQQIHTKWALELCYLLQDQWKINLHASISEQIY